MRELELKDRHFRKTQREKRFRARTERKEQFFKGAVELRAPRRISGDLFGFECFEKVDLIAGYCRGISKHLHGGGGRKVSLLRRCGDRDRLNRTNFGALGCRRQVRRAIALAVDGPNRIFGLFDSRFEPTEVNQRCPEEERTNRFGADARELIGFEKLVDGPIRFREGFSAHLDLEIGGPPVGALLHLHYDPLDIGRQAVSVGDERPIRIGEEIFRPGRLAGIGQRMKVGIIEDDLDRIIGHGPPPSRPCAAFSA